MFGIKKEQSAGKCVYCGNNPVPHFLNWYNESLIILAGPFRRLVMYNFFTRWVDRYFFGPRTARAAVRFFEAAGIIRRQCDKESCKVARARVFWDEAEKRGIKMCELLLFGRPFDTYIAEKKDGRLSAGHGKSSLSTLHPQCRTLVFSGLPRLAGYRDDALDVMDDKWHVKKLFLKNNLPVPAGAAVTTFGRALKIFRHIKEGQTPVIVKPRTGSRGRHSTTFVRTENDLKKAFRIAKKLNFWVMVEQQLEGSVYRATVINYKLAGVLRGDPPQVCGDGAHTLEQLINIKNSLPHPGVKDIIISGEMERFVERELGANTKFQISNFKPEKQNILGYIPLTGEIVNLSEKIGVNYGGSSSEDYDICHPDNRELFERAARIVGNPIVGFDFIIPDITASYKNQKCGFIEANSLPFINLHHDPLLGKPRNVAAMVWDMLGW